MAEPDEGDRHVWERGPTVDLRDPDVQASVHSTRLPGAPASGWPARRGDDDDAALLVHWVDDKGAVVRLISTSTTGERRAKP